ncbi:MAG: DEAD/DEAH box helicase [Salinivirgaceae bacterium]|nr:DEAD/DEAH box helicase [Salinivirgaceae bacterium]
MKSTFKNQEDILNKLGIEQLNPMQEETFQAIKENSDVVLLSPTGTGKTLAFLMPLLETLDTECDEIQLLILVPSRELAIQIEQVTREMGTGFKTNAIYGGRTGTQDKLDLKHKPAILIGTPGRIADHLRRGSFSANSIHTLVLDEFDKSLEIGFEKEMIEIVDALDYLKKKILTSATEKKQGIPAFVGIKKPVIINYLHESITQLKIKAIVSPDNDKLETLVKAISHIGNQPGIVFCNFKDTIQQVSDYLADKGVNHGCFFGGMEQRDRELALVKFRNGTHQLLIATDLAARGIDVPEIKFILHFELPMKSHEFTHRNGRTARMNADGTAYVLHCESDDVPGFIELSEVENLTTASIPTTSLWTTLHVTGGRRDKISKGDVAGLFFKQGLLNKDELGTIELKADCTYVAVHTSKVNKVIELTNNAKLKTKKVRVSVI